MSLGKSIRFERGAGKSVNIECSLWCGGKCLSRSSRKVRAMFVGMFLLNGGLYQIVFRCRVRRLLMELVLALGS